MCHGEPPQSESLDAYLDGQMTADEERAFEQRMKDSGIDISGDIHLQLLIDDAIVRQLRPPVPSQIDREGQWCDSLPTVTPQGASGSAKVRRRRIVAVAMAGAVAWVSVTIGLLKKTPSEPVFASRPLTEIYREAVTQGFEPYYECRDPERFTYTFEQRQGISVALDPMPVGSSMLGLSYSGGLSRDTTVMLCQVNEQPVMVFVDRVSADQPKSDIVAATNGLFVHRAQRSGLVMYEVTPLRKPRAMQYLRIERKRY